MGIGEDLLFLVTLYLLRYNTTLVNITKIYRNIYITWHIKLRRDMKGVGPVMAIPVSRAHLRACNAHQHLPWMSRGGGECLRSALSSLE